MFKVLLIDDERTFPELDLDAVQIDLLMRIGRWREVCAALEIWFDRLAEGQIDSQTAKAYVILLYVSIAAQGPKENMQQYIKGLAAFENMKTLHSMRDFMLRAAKDMSMSHRRAGWSNKKSIIMKMKEIVDENIGNPKLSLHWAASEILYMNADYLGKQFKKETGLTYSQYVTRKRIERAIVYITSHHDVKVFQLAEMFGYGDNPQYFSQVFKKQIGMTPSELIHSLRAGRQQPAD